MLYQLSYTTIHWLPVAKYPLRTMEGIRTPISAFNSPQIDTIEVPTGFEPAYERLTASYIAEYATGYRGTLYNRG